MKLATTLLACSTFLSLSMAAHADSLPLNRIAMTLSAQKWVTANTAKVSIAINAALTETQLTHFQQNLQSTLKHIHNGSHWQILQFNQTTSASGLQDVSAIAQTRVNAKALQQIVSQTQQMSGQGTRYKIISINFTPALSKSKQHGRI